MRDVVEDDETADLFHLPRNKGGDSDIDGGLAVGRLEGELIEVVDADLVAGSVQLNQEGGGQEFGQGATGGVLTANAGQALHLRVPALDAIIEAYGENTDVDGFDDVFAELFEAFVLSGFFR